MKQLLPLLLSALALTVCLAFGYVAFSVATRGTGEQLPRGAGVVEGTLAPARLAESPVGEAFLYGEVRIAKPEGSSAVDQSWASPAGDPRVTVLVADGTETRLRLPPARDWKGTPRKDERVVEHLDGLPIVGDVDDAESRMSPPYLVIVRALRPRDHVIAKADGETVTELWVGERAELQAMLARQETMRWPIVGLMGIMALVSLALSVLGLRRARGAARP